MIIPSSGLSGTSPDGPEAQSRRGDSVSAARLCHRLALLVANTDGAALGQEYVVQPLGAGCPRAGGLL